MIENIYTIGPTILGGFLFTFASKCIPTFFSVFLLSKGYNNRDIILISSVFFLGALCVKNPYRSITNSMKIFHICATTASIILLLQAYVTKVWIWFLIRFLQGILETLCRNCLYTLMPTTKIQLLIFFMNFGSTIGFLLMCYEEAFPFLFTITGIVLNLSHMSLSFKKNEAEIPLPPTISPKPTKSLKDIFVKNHRLFISLILSCLLVSTFGTLLPITLKNNGFYNKQILPIMFIGSLGHTLIQMANYYLKNILGDNNDMKMHIYSLFILYICFFFSLRFAPFLISIFVFFIIGLHQSLHSNITSLVREENQSSPLQIRYATSQINNIGAISASIIALMFISAFPKYGIFGLWFLCLILIRFLIKNSISHMAVNH